MRQCAQTPHRTPIACAPSRSDRKRRQCRYIVRVSRDWQSGTFEAHVSPTNPARCGVKPIPIVNRNYCQRLMATTFAHAFTEREQWIPYISLAATTYHPVRACKTGPVDDDIVVLGESLSERAWNTSCFCSATTSGWTQELFLSLSNPPILPPFLSTPVSMHCRQLPFQNKRYVREDWLQRRGSEGRGLETMEPS